MLAYSYKRMNESAATPEPHTRQRLLRAARKTFAEKGFAAASVREITTAADANVGAVTYHFGSKQALYDAVLETVFGSLRERVAAADAARAGEAAPWRIEAMLRAMFSVVRENPDLPHLLLQQVVVTHELPGPALQTFPKVFGMLRQAVMDGQAEGTIRRGDPLLLAISTVSQPAYFGVLARLLLERLPAVLGPLPDWDDIEAHAVQFVRGGMAPGLEASQ